MPLITSARLAAAVPSAVRSNSRLAAGVRFPSVFLGVQLGGSIFPPGVRETFPGARGPCSKPAFARKLREAFAESRCEIASREDGAGRWNGVLGGGRGPLVCESTRGVPVSVPQVISCLTASGPNSEGVGEGMLGTREKLLIVGDLGRSVVC